jgi:hypothetical protein
MKWLKPVLVLMLLLGAAASDGAWAHRGHGRVGVGVVIGAPWGWPGYYYPPYYGYPPYHAYPAPVVVESSPPVYIEQRSAEPAAEPEEGYWYYCRKSKAYYPYVNKCPGGWQKVAPQPPSEP